MPWYPEAELAVTSIIDSGILSNEPGRGAFMPAITPLPDGALIACQHVGAGIGTPDNLIEVLRSNDRGATAAGLASFMASSIC